MNTTPEQKWNASIIAFRKNCQKIIEVSKSIRYAGVINEYGRTLTGIVQPGVVPLWKSEQVKNEFFIISILMTLRNSYSQKVGPLDFLLLKHRKVSIVAFQRKNITYYISIDATEKDVEKLLPKIKKII